jgi:uncharacterized membrane-anchored protein YhcB (DUF1043 family)
MTRAFGVESNGANLEHLKGHYQTLMKPIDRLKRNMETLRESIDQNKKDFAQHLITTKELLDANAWCLNELEELKRRLTEEL